MPVVLDIAYDLEMNTVPEDMHLNCVKSEHQDGPIKIYLGSSKSNSSYRYIRINIEPGVEFTINQGHILKNNVHILWYYDWYVLDDDFNFIAPKPRFNTSGFVQIARYKSGVK